MKTKKHLSIIVLGITLTIIGSMLWKSSQVKASDPDTKHQIYLPLVINEQGQAAAVALTTPINEAQITGQGGRIDAFTFYLPYTADLLDDQFNIGQTQQNLLNVDIEYITSIAVLADGVKIFYDQWEDGLETDLTKATQFTTQIWGDNDPSNGIPPGYSTDFLTNENVITLTNTIPVPRNTNEILFDGGDTFTAIDGPVAASITFWTDSTPPNTGPAILFADAWELYPTNRWGEVYRIPIGENTNRPTFRPSGRPGGNSFEIVGLNIQAVEDNTQVTVDLNADGVPDDLNGDGLQNDTIILNQGQQFNRIGAPNGLGPESTLAGATVLATQPVQVHLFTANPASRYEARGYTLLPFEQWTNDYLAPRSSDGDFWLFNPNNTPIVVNVDTSLGPTVQVSIPANSTVKYPGAGLNAATGIRFRSVGGENFYGIAALDDRDAQDWGYALLPFNRLATQTLVGLGPGNYPFPSGPQNGGTGFESPVYVTAATATTLFVDYNNINDTDTGPDATFSVGALAEVAIVDPNDFDMTGAFLSTDVTPFIAVWGQDQNASPALPSIDAGTGVVPLPSLLVQKTFTNTSCADTVTLGDIITFKLQYFNTKIRSIPDVIITDTMPAQVAYITNTTRLNGTLLRDAGTGTPFLLDEGGYNVGAVATLDRGYLTFDALVTNDRTGKIINQAEAVASNLPLGSDQATISITAQPAPPILEVKQTLVSPANGFASVGQVITFSLTITNLSSSIITQIPLQDTFDETLLTLLNSNPPPDLSSSGVFTWTDLTTTFGDLAPGAAFSATITFVVDQTPPSNPNTLNTTTVLKARRSDNAFPLTCSDQAAVSFFAPQPAIQVKKATNGFDADNPNNDPVPQIKPGDTVTWDYVVTNIGNVPLTNVVLVDDQLALQGIAPTFVSGDTNGDNNLDLTEIWRYRASGVAPDLGQDGWPERQCGVGGQRGPLYTNLATTTGEYGPATVIDDDPSHYCQVTKKKCEGDCKKVTPPPPTPCPANCRPTPVPPGDPTPGLPVVFLPETGDKDTSQIDPIISTAWLWLGAGVILILYWQGRGKLRR
jgi:uncharacterized repeat protein (TIGR01451 family)